MDRVAVALLTVVFCVQTAFGQVPRSPQRLDPTSTLSRDPVIASAGDVSVVAWAEAGAVYAARSDGRGTTWSAAVRVDGDGTGAKKDLESGDLLVVGGSAYVIWRDERHGANHREIYFSRSTDGGATWAPEQRIDKSVPVGIGTVRDHRLAVGATSPASVHVLLSIDATLLSNEILILVRSTDGGQTFAPATVVPQGIAAGAADVDNVDAVADGSTLYVAWVDDRLGEDDVYLQKSTDAGATWLAQDLQLDSSVGGNAEDIPCLAVSGNMVAVAWLEERPKGAPESLRANVSVDGAASFGGDVLVGSYIVNLVDVDNPQLVITGNGDLVAAWDDNRFGFDEVFAAASSDGGLSWAPDVQLSSSSGEFPRLATSGADEVVVVWTGGVFPEKARAALSTDGGATWLPRVEASPNPGDADSAEVAYNARYHNFAMAYLADDFGVNNVYAGGFRPQTVLANGWNTRTSPAWFDVHRAGAANVALIGLSTGTGPLTIPGDGRLLELSGDPLLAATLSSPLFVAPIVNGDGSTTAIPNPFANLAPVGLTIHYAAIALDGSGGITALTDPSSFQL